MKGLTTSAATATTTSSTTITTRITTSNSGIATTTNIAPTTTSFWTLPGKLNKRFNNQSLSHLQAEGAGKVRKGKSLPLESIIDKNDVIRDHRGQVEKL